MGIFEKLLKRDDPLVTTPPMTIVVTKKPKKAPAKKPAKAKPAPKKAPAKKPAAKKTTTRGPRKDYKGDVHEVVDLEGIGPSYAKRLRDNRIYHTQHLLFASDARLQKITGANQKTVQNWKHMSQLVKIKGIGPQFAELMVRAGIGGIDGLKEATPAAAVKQINDYEAGLNTNVTGSGIGTKRMASWITTARKMRKVPIDLKKIEVVALESRAAKANTKAPTKKAPAKRPAKKQVTRSGYLLYQSGSRYFFSKKKAPQKGWKKITTIPTGYQVKVTKNGLPVLAKK